GPRSGTRAPGRHLRRRQSRSPTRNPHPESGDGAFGRNWPGAAIAGRGGAGLVAARHGHAGGRDAGRPGPGDVDEEEVAEAVAAEELERAAGGSARLLEGDAGGGRRGGLHQREGLLAVAGAGERIGDLPEDLRVAVAEARQR